MACLRCNAKTKNWPKTNVYSVILFWEIYLFYIDMLAAYATKFNKDYPWV